MLPFCDQLALIVEQRVAEKKLFLGLHSAAIRQHIRVFYDFAN